MTSAEVAAEIQRHRWRVVELKADLHDEETAIAQLQAVYGAAKASEDAAAEDTAEQPGPRRPRRS